MDGIDTESLCHRKKQRGCDHQGSAALQEHAHKQQYDIYQHQEYILVGGESGNRRRNDFGQVDHAHVITKGTGRDHDQNDTGCTCDGVQHNGDKVLSELQLSIDKFTDDKAVQHSHSTAFGRGEQTESHTEDDTEGEEQTPEGNERLFQDFLHGRELFACSGIIAFVGNDRHYDHHGDTHQNAGYIAGCEDTSERGLGNQRIDDQVYSGRNDRSRCRGRSCDCC